MIHFPNLGARRRFDVPSPSPSLDGPAWARRAARAALAAAAIWLLTATASSAASRGCDRNCLHRLVERAFVSLADGKPDRAFARGVRITENGLPIAANASTLRSRTALTHTNAFGDASRGEAGVYGVIQDGETRGVFSVRIAIRGRKIREIETLVVRRGEAAILSPDTMVEQDHWRIIPPKPQRASRAELIALAGAYFDAIESGDAAAVPAAPTCSRQENGGTTRRADKALADCRDLSSFTGVTRVRDRRYPVIDEELGVIWALAVFDRSLDEAPRSVLAGELLKVEAGRVTHIEAVVRDAPPGAGSGWD